MSALDGKSKRCRVNRFNRFLIFALLLALAFTTLGLGLYIHRVNTGIGVAIGKAVLPGISNALRDELLARDKFKLLFERLAGDVDCKALADLDPPVASFLRSDRTGDRITAAFVLGECQQLALGAIDELTEALNDSDPTVRAYAAYALRQLSHPANTTAPE